MRTTAAARIRHKPYGLAFSIEDLGEIGRWAQAHRLVMRVVLDHVIDGYEFEEMIVLSAPARRDRRIMLWRSFGTIYAQASYSRPHAFTTVTQALAWLSPAAPTPGYATVFRRLFIMKTPRAAPHSAPAAAPR